MKIIVKTDQIKICTIGPVNDLIPLVPGEYEVEEIDNPFGTTMPRWYRFKGYNAGGSVTYFQKHLLCSLVDDAKDTKQSGKNSS